jgi:antitoxin ParD1/3/4
MIMKILTISITPQQEKFIQSQIESGRYPSADEMIAMALELLEESIYLEDSDNKFRYEKWFGETKKKIAIGIEASERGEVFDGEEVIQEILDEISLEERLEQ